MKHFTGHRIWNSRIKRTKLECLKNSHWFVLNGTLKKTALIRWPLIKYDFFSRRYPKPEFFQDVWKLVNSSLFLSPPLFNLKWIISCRLFFRKWLIGDWEHISSCLENSNVSFCFFFHSDWALKGISLMLNRLALIRKDGKYWDIESYFQLYILGSHKCTHLFSQGKL